MRSGALCLRSSARFWSGTRLGCGTGFRCLTCLWGGAGLGSRTRYLRCWTLLLHPLLFLRLDTLLLHLLSALLLLYLLVVLLQLLRALLLLLLQLLSVLLLLQLLAALLLLCVALLILHVVLLQLLVPQLFVCILLLFVGVVLLQVLIAQLLVLIALLFVYVSLLLIDVVLLRILIALLNLGAALLNLLHVARGLSDGASATSLGPCEGLCGTTVVGGEALLRVVEGGLTKLLLLADWSGVRLAHGCELSLLGTNVQTAAAAVVADAVVGPHAVGAAVVDHGAVVDVGVVDAADVVDRAIVVEVMPAPEATKVADADVAEAVVDATVEAYVRAPVAVVEGIAATVPAPVRRRPESTVVGRWHPGAGNPVVASWTPGPVAGRPEIVGVRSGGLIVLG